MLSESVEKILSDEQFIKELEGAIDCGKSIDYAYDGENEIPIDTFDTDTARSHVMELLKKYLIQK